MEEKSIEYEPTKCEQKLLEVLLNPENKDKTVLEICGIAKIDPKTYYNAFKKPGFKALYKGESQSLVVRNISPIVHAFIKEAISGSFQHGKVLLEMADMYSEKKKIEANVNATVDINVTIVED